MYFLERLKMIFFKKQYWNDNILNQHKLCGLNCHTCDLGEFNNFNFLYYFLLNYIIIKIKNKKIN